MIITPASAQPVLHSQAYDAEKARTAHRARITPETAGYFLMRLASDMDAELKRGSQEARAIATDLLKYEQEHPETIQEQEARIRQKVAEEKKKPTREVSYASEKTEACKECGATFTHVPGRKYCSEKCSREYWRRQAESKKVVGAWRKEKPCPICRAVFIPHHASVKTCSEACRFALIAANARTQYHAKNIRRVQARAQKKASASP